MTSHTPPSDKCAHIVEKAKLSGASLAGIASVDSLRSSPSHQTHGKFELPAAVKSVLVLALVHEQDEPELDWWDDKKGGTPGNRRLGSIAKRLSQWLKEECNIIARPLAYHVDQGGVFLKDAAALAGLGILGKNNLLITPRFGPRVRFRALFLDRDFEPTGPIDFSPCEACDMRCWRACPRKAFKNGSYRRALCNGQMKEDEGNKAVFEKPESDDSSSRYIKYCRACELACPVAG